MMKVPSNLVGSFFQFIGHIKVYIMSNNNCRHLIIINQMDYLQIYCLFILEFQWVNTNFFFSDLISDIFIWKSELSLVS